MPYVRTVKTSSGATAVQIVFSSHRGSRQIEHLGSAHSDAEVELLKAAARQRLAAGQGELDQRSDGLICPDLPQRMTNRTTPEPGDLSAATDLLRTSARAKESASAATGELSRVRQDARMLREFVVVKLAT